MKPYGLKNFRGILGQRKNGPRGFRAKNCQCCFANDIWTKAHRFKTRGRLIGLQEIREQVESE